MARDLYGILGLTTGASQDEIIEAFYKLSQKYYPLAPTSPAAQLRMDRIAHAWEVLSDRQLREAYDARQRRLRRGMGIRDEQVPERAVTGVPAAARPGAREPGKSQNNLILITLTAIILMVVYGIGPQEPGAFRAAMQAEAAGQPESAQIQTVEQIAEPEVVSTLAPVAAAQEPQPAEPAPLSDSDVIAASTETPEAPVPAEALIPETGGAADPTEAPLPMIPPLKHVTATRVPAVPIAVVKKPVVARPTVTPTAAATATGYKYLAPTLLSPTAGSTFSCPPELVLSWKLQSAGNLADDEWFLVEARGVGHEYWLGVVDWLHEQTVTLGSNKQGKGCDLTGLPIGSSEWRVRVVKGDRASHTIQRFLSLPSDPWIISYGH